MKDWALPMGLVAFGLILVYMTTNIGQSFVDGSIIWIAGWISIVFGVALAALRVAQRQRINNAKEAIIPAGLAMIALLTTAIFAPQYYAHSVISAFVIIIFSAIFMLAVTLHRLHLDIRDPQMSFAAGLLLLPAIAATGLAELNFSAGTGGIVVFVLALMGVYYATRPATQKSAVKEKPAKKKKRRR